jgi:hypothetical protein
MTKIILAGTPSELKPIITLLMGIYQLIETGDFGGGSESPRELAPKRKGKLKVRLMFFEPRKLVKPGYKPIKGEISFRLMAYDPTSITLKKVQEIATRIKAKFDKFEWHRGKVLCSYSDWDKGLQLQLLVKDENEGWRIVNRVLDIFSSSPHPEYFNVIKNKTPEKRYPAVPDKQTILGKPVRMDRQRPVTTVVFDRADLFFPHSRTPYKILDAHGNIIKQIKITDTIKK